jgi:hypothetical protein
MQASAYQECEAEATPCPLSSPGVSSLPWPDSLLLMQLVSQAYHV